MCGWEFKKYEMVDRVRVLFSKMGEDGRMSCYYTIDYILKDKGFIVENYNDAERRVYITIEEVEDYLFDLL